MSDYDDMPSDRYEALVHLMTHCGQLLKTYEEDHGQFICTLAGHFYDAELISDGELIAISMALADAAGAEVNVTTGEVH